MEFFSIMWKLYNYGIDGKKLSIEQINFLKIAEYQDLNIFHNTLSNPESLHGKL